MPLHRSLLFFILFAAGCSSHPNNTQQHYQNLKQLSPPGSQKYTPAKAYVDSVKLIRFNTKQALLISGNLSSGCTKLQKAGHAIRHDSLIISITAWQPAGEKCTQALVPFQFIYDQVSGSKLQNISSVSVNQRHIELK